VFGDGGFRGFFVIESIKVKSQQLSAGGAPIAIRVALALKEWIADAQSLFSTLSLGAFTTLGITTASTGTPASGSNGTMPGVSALLNIPSPTGTSGPNLEADDVPAAVIVRSVAR
jgi:hypothetical protein